jgi:hypothetical protein
MTGFSLLSSMESMANRQVQFPLSFPADNVPVRFSLSRPTLRGLWGLLLTWGCALNRRTPLTGVSERILPQKGTFHQVDAAVNANVYLT